MSSTPHPTHVPDPGLAEAYRQYDAARAPAPIRAALASELQAHHQRVTDAAEAANAAAVLVESRERELEAADAALRRANDRMHSADERERAARKAYVAALQRSGHVDTAAGPAPRVADPVLSEAPGPAGNGCVRCAWYGCPCSGGTPCANPDVHHMAIGRHAAAPESSWDGRTSSYGIGTDY